MVDVTSPLCRGRVITLPNGKKHWTKFRYEHLPSICYWCGRLDHDDRDCDLWIQSNGSLKMDQQQFGSFLRAPPYKSSGRDMIYVPGYYEGKNNKARKKFPISNASQFICSIVCVSRTYLELILLAMNH